MLYISMYVLRNLSLCQILETIPITIIKRLLIIVDRERGMEEGGWGSGKKKMKKMKKL